ncbi:MAG TPA: hypothetical protein VLV86_22930 [Vicinamibacterales bacterium]|nr:hypothetical protein [Vicinamibacterales bacterium]
MPGVDKRRAATILWIVLAVVVWNVVFDHVIVEAGRAYVRAAWAAARAGGPYERIDDWMRPARWRALWWATGSGVAILVAGLAAVRRASRRT